ncbi:MAG: MMPL family transporter [Dehalococcoidia bacterium]
MRGPEPKTAPVASRVFSGIAHVVANKRNAWIIIALWLGLVVASRFAPRPRSSSQQQDFLPSNDDSIVAAHIANDPAKFPRTGQLALPMVIIFRDENGLSPDDFARARRVSDYLNDQSQRPQQVTAVASVFSADQVAANAPPPKDPRFLSDDGKTMTMTAFFSGGNFSQADKLAEPAKTVEQFVKDQESGAPNLKTGVSGIVAQIVDSSKAFKNLNGTLLPVTVILIIVLLLAIYRSVILIWVPLLSVGLAYLLSAGLFGLIASAFSIVVNPQSTSLAIVLILGAGTDYTLFIASRYREELRQNQSKYVAMWHTMANIGEAIASSALIVVITLISLVFASLKFFSNLGPSAALAIACMLLAGLTLVPAILVLLGRYSFWPVMPRYGDTHRDASGFWARVASIVAKRPGMVFAVTGGFFVILALATFGLKQRYDFVSNFPSNFPSRQGQGLLEKAGPTEVGKLSPTQIYVSSSDPIASHLGQLAAISDAAAKTDGVQRVIGFSGSPAPTIQQILQQDAALPASQRQLSADGKTAQITIFLNRDPYKTPAMDIIQPLRNTTRAAVAGSGLQIHVGGETAQNADTRSDTARDLELLGPIILLAIALILGLLLRSIVAPAYLVASTLLSYLATLGLTGMVFQDLLGSTGVQNFVPPFMAVFLIALGADYNVFIMSRVREEAHRVGIHDGTRLALARTGGVITSAGVILAGTFAVLLILPLQFLQQIGFAVAAGVLLDTFIVRALFVPSIVFLLGRWNWWPSRESQPAVEEAVA